MFEIEKTIEYYNKNAADFASKTFSVEFKSIQDIFADKLSEGGLILDFGCGAGRDTCYFILQGFEVEALDGSEELCKIAREHTGKATGSSIHLLNMEPLRESGTADILRI